MDPGHMGPWSREELPVVTGSGAGRGKASCATPYAKRVEPSRAELCSNTGEPMCTKSSADDELSKQVRP